MQLFFAINNIGKVNASKLIYFLAENRNDNKLSMAQPLKKLEIKGFKSIRSLNLELKRLNILIGANGSGKSNFIATFKFINQIINQNLEFFVAKSGGANTILHFGQKTTQQLEFYFEFSPNIYQIILEVTADGKLIFADERVYFQSPDYEQPYSQSLGKGHYESKLIKTVANSKIASISDYVLSAIKSWKVYHFHDTSDTALIKQNVDLDDNDSLKQDGSNLAAYLYLLRETERNFYNNIVDTISLVAPFFDDFNLQPNRLNQSKIKLEWREKGSDNYFDANALSDGTLRFMSLATLLLQPPDKLPQIILLDEPELGLHPYAVVILADLLSKVSKDTQVIISTQSVTLVNQFEPEDIIVVEKRGGESILERLSSVQIESWLDDYGLGDLWEKNLLGGRPTQ